MLAIREDLLRRPEAASFELVEDVAGQTYIYSSCTGELHHLGSGAQQWELVVDDDGVPICQCADGGVQSLWLYDEVAFVPYVQDETEERFVGRRGDGDSLTLVHESAFARSHRCFRAGFQAPGAGHWCGTAFLHELAIDGNRIWWSLPQVFSATLQQGRRGKARNKQLGRIMSEACKAWTTWAVKLGLLPPAGATPYCRAGDDVANYTDRCHAQNRLHTVRTANTACTLACLARWAFADRAVGGCWFTRRQKRCVELVGGMVCSRESGHFERGAHTFRRPPFWPGLEHRWCVLVASTRWLGASCATSGGVGWPQKLPLGQRAWWPQHERDGPFREIGQRCNGQGW